MLGFLNHLAERSEQISFCLIFPCYCSTTFAQTDFMFISLDKITFMVPLFIFNSSGIFQTVYPLSFLIIFVTFYVLVSVVEIVG